MTQAALASGLLWLGFRVVVVVAQNLISANLGQYNHVRGVKGREAIHTGCGCMAWMDTEEATRCDL